MKFCPVCDNFMLIKKVTNGKKSKETKRIFYCPSCNYEEPFDEKDRDIYKIKEKIQHDGKDKTVVTVAAVVNGATVTEEDREANEDLFGRGSD
ncbi:MAG: hypothetical protein ACTSWN_15435 [Promethearchaeota archaeon]